MYPSVFNCDFQFSDCRMCPMKRKDGLHHTKIWLINDMSLYIHCNVLLLHVLFLSGFIFLKQPLHWILYSDERAGLLNKQVLKLLIVSLIVHYFPSLVVDLVQKKMFIHNSCHWFNYQASVFIRGMIFFLPWILRLNNQSVVYLRPSAATTAKDVKCITSLSSGEYFSENMRLQLLQLGYDFLILFCTSEKCVLAR